MQISRRSRRIFQSCLSELFSLYKNGFCSTPRVYIWNRENRLKARSASLNRSSWPKCRLINNGAASTEQPYTKYPGGTQIRYFIFGRSNRIENEFSEASQAADSRSYRQMEATARRARQTFAETLPRDFLTLEEYKIYERLYGPPTRETRPEDVSLLQDFGEGGEEGEAEEEELSKTTLFMEDAQGNLKEVAYERKKFEEFKHRVTEEELGLFTGIENSDSSTRLGDRATGERDPLIQVATEIGKDHVDMALEELEATGRGEASEMKVALEDVNETDFKARLALYKDIADAKRTAELQNSKLQELESEEEDNAIIENEEAPDEEQDYDEDIEGLEDFDENSDTVRSHPLTSAGRFGTSPTSLQMPKNAMIDPITSLLADASNKHLKEVAQKVFGGPRLPNSTATPSTKEHLQQQPIALEASQFRMGEMEANAYMVANIPGIYAAVMSALVEVRKRVGSKWVRGLLEKDGGPLILDAGGGGAGVLAWQDILRAEIKLLNGGSEPDIPPVDLGKSTVVVGSSALRHRASHLLENTTFLPRLPDYNPSLDHPSKENPNASPRKRYDIIIAPHTLWTLKQDYMRKSRVENLWSLLNPNGGILIIIEKGVPRGFELVAGARETLLKHHIASPESPTVENQIDEPFADRHRDKETGMIIAPCTNHFKCPLYLTPGQTKGRKDFCHFSQRFLRPHYLQRVLGAKERNHEDVRFSYVAVQRGVDQRQSHGILQGPEATEAAFEGYEEKEQMDDENLAERMQAPESVVSNVHPLSLPRSILSPLKRRGHVIIDLCTPSGKLERWTVPRSFSKQAYRDARKSRWGDLWALGAKTRITRNVRLGVKNQEQKGKRAKQPDRDGEGEDDDLWEMSRGKEDDFRQMSQGKDRFEKRTKRGRTSKPKTEYTEDDI